MLTRPPRELERTKRNAYWQKFVDYLAISAELSNAGIFLEVIGRWIPSFANFVAATPLAYLLLIGDPLIYFFRSLIRLTHLIGRNVFNIQFEEEKNGPPPKLQTLSDLLSLTCFSLSVALFCGVLVAPPIGITLAWVAGLSGLGFVSVTDYLWPEKQAYKKYEALLNNKDASDEMKVDAYKEYTQLKKTRQMYVGLIFNLALLLICGSAVAFAPPLLVPVLYVASNAASLVLAAIGCGRLYNWYTSRKAKKITANEGTSLSSMPEQPVSEIELSSLGARPGFSKTPSAPMLPPVLVATPSSQEKCTVLSPVSESKSMELRSGSPANSGFFSQNESRNNLSPANHDLGNKPDAAAGICASTLVY